MQVWGHVHLFQAAEYFKCLLQTPKAFLHDQMEAERASGSGEVKVRFGGSLLELGT